MNAGGYQIIDFTGKKFEYNGVDTYVIPGIYEKIEGTVKPILLTGVYVDATESPLGKTYEFKNTFKNPILEGSVYQFVFSTGTDFELNQTVSRILITVDDNDTVRLMLT